MKAFVYFLLLPVQDLHLHRHSSDGSVSVCAGNCVQSSSIFLHRLGNRAELIKLELWPILRVIFSELVKQFTFELQFPDYYLLESIFSLPVA
jgi:hypothetical protein